MSTRKLMVPVTREVRAYFAPVQRPGGIPALFDPAKHGAFDLDAPPAPWLDLGWAQNLKRTSTTKTESACAGSKGASGVQYRTGLEARVEVEFREWGKLQMALAAGSQHMNVLAAETGGEEGASGGAPVAAVPLLAGSTSTELKLGANAGQFEAGDLVAVDLDYQQQTGYVGAGIAAAYVRDPMDVLQHPDYIRRVTFNVGRVAGKTGDVLVLDQPLLGGVPPSGAAVQKVMAFVDREGGSFFQEWSALLVLPEESGGRVCFYYPRLQSGAPASEAAVEIARPLEAMALRASFMAMPYEDRNDGEQVVCFRSYFPAVNAPVY
ncbi:MAG TPA: hypothetical protein VN622_02500 [Clostridia bacterium]|nr:hypothetical protein [Clostridia bacterium]